MDSKLRTDITHQTREYFKNVPLHALVAEHGTPLLLLDVARITQQYQLLQQTMPGVRFYYALKALTHPLVIAAIAKQQGYMDVATPIEINLALAGGMQPAQLMHTHPIKKPSEIEQAYNAGIRTFVLDNVSELEKFIGRPNDIQLLIRLSYHNASAKSDLSYKFGAMPEEAGALLLAALKNKLNVVGFSLHVGSQSSDPQAFRVAITKTVELMDKLEKQHGIKFSVLNMGGGFPIRYREAVPSIQEIADVVNPVIQPLMQRYTIYAEPGRFVAAPAMHAITSIVGTAHRQDVPWYYLDDGLYGSYGNVIWEDVKPAIIAEKELAADMPAEAFEPSVLAGPTCDSVDIIDTDYPMPKLVPGDLLITPCMGSYTSTTATEFNGIPPAPIIVLGQD